MTRNCDDFYINYSKKEESCAMKFQKDSGSFGSCISFKNHKSFVLALALATIGGGGLTPLCAAGENTTVNITLKADQEAVTADTNWGTTAAAEVADKLVIKTEGTVTGGTVSTTNADKINITIEQNTDDTKVNIKNNLTVGRADGGQNITLTNHGTVGDVAGGNKFIVTDITAADKPMHNLTLTNNGKFQSDMELNNSIATVNNTKTIDGHIKTTGKLIINNKEGAVIGKDDTKEIKVGDDTAGKADREASLTIFNGNGAEIKSKIVAAGNKSTVEIQNFFGTLGAIDTSKAVQTTLKSLEGKITGDVNLGAKAHVELSGVAVEKKFDVGSDSKILLGDVNDFASEVTIGTNANISVGERNTFKGAVSVGENAKIAIGENNAFKGNVSVGTKSNVTIGKGTVFEAGTANNNTLKIGAATADIESNSHVVNMGTINSSSMELTGTGNTLANQMGGSIATLKFSGTGGVFNGKDSTIASFTATSDAANKPTTVSVNNAGVIETLRFDQASAGTNSVSIMNNTGRIDKISVKGENNTLNIGGSYSVNMENYDAGNGAINVEMDANAKLTVNLGTLTRSGNKPTIMLNGLSNGIYDLSKFITTTGAGGGHAGSGTLTVNINGQAVTDWANVGSNIFTTPQSIYDINVAGGKIHSRVLPERSLGAFGMLHAVSSFNSQIFRVTNMVDSAFEAVSYGEIGPMGYTKKTDAVEDSEVGNENQENFNNQRNGFITYLMPYYSYSSLSSGVLGTTGSSFGIVGGITKDVKDGILFGIHMAFDSNVYGNSQDEMQMQGNSYMVGLHTKVPFMNFQTNDVTLIPYVKAQVNAMVSTNTYKLTPKLSNTIEDTTAIGGYSMNVSGGLDVHTNYGVIATEISLMHQGVFASGLNWSGFQVETNNQSVQAQSAMPLYVLAHVRYAKSFNINENFMLYPTLKVGLRSVLAGGSYKTTLMVQGLNNGFMNYNGVTNLDAIAGFAEVGLGMRIIKSLGLNFSYNGEFSKQINNHGFYARLAWGF